MGKNLHFRHKGWNCLNYQICSFYQWISIYKRPPDPGFFFFFFQISRKKGYKFLWFQVNLFRKTKKLNTSVFIIKHSNSPKIFINKRFDIIIKLNNKRYMVPVQKNKANFGMVDKLLFGSKKSLNS